MNYVRPKSFYLCIATQRQGWQGRGRKGSFNSVWSSLVIILSLSKNCSFFSLYVHITWLWSALEIAWKSMICVGKRVAKLTETTVNVHSSCWRTKWHLLCILDLHHTTSVRGCLPGSKQMVAMQIQDIYQPWSWSISRNIRAGILGGQPEFLWKVLNQRLADAVADFCLSLWGWSRFFLQGEFDTELSLQGTRPVPSIRHLFLVCYQ